MKQIVVSLFVAMSLILCGCNNSSSNSNKKNISDSLSVSGSLVAFVEMDTIVAKYQFCIDQMNQINQKQATYDQQLQGEARGLQNYAQQVQQKLQNNGYSTQQQYEAAMQEGQNRENKYQQHQQQYQADLMQMSDKYITEFYQRLRDFLKEYNKDGKFALILTNSASAVNVLQADPALDITNDILEGLNKAYKAPEKKADKKETVATEETNTELQDSKKK
ncbi:MAG: OmpH family outer membrane protein [Alloprevotella sp.]|nr:OmpH family outer membrane protein [Alloprevotella sp.]